MESDDKPDQPDPSSPQRLPYQKPRLEHQDGWDIAIGNVSVAH